MNFIKELHYSEELENAVLGACLLEKEAFGRTFGILEKDNLYFFKNQHIYDALAFMYSNGVPVDCLTVIDYFVSQKNMREFNGEQIAYIVCKTTNSVVSSAHLEYHCYILKRMWMEREVLKLTHGGLILEGEVKSQLSQLNQAIQKINSGIYKKEWSDLSELMYGLAKHQEEMTRTQGKGLTTGIRVLDKENGGFFPGQLIVIGARPSVGKSAFMGQMALAMAKQKKVVGIISLEMNNNEIAARLSSIETEDNFKTIFRNLYRDEDHRANWYEKIGRMVDIPIYVSDATDVNHADIKAKAQKLKHKHGLDCLMIDYLQLVNSESTTSRNRTRENEVSQISRHCKLIAKELNIPVIILCQLNRESTKRSGTDRYPMLNDLRESGSIEQDADVVMFIHRDWMCGEKYMVDEAGESTENKADLIVRKWRNGAPNLRIPMLFDGPRMLFRQTDNLDRWKPEADPKEETTPF